MSKFQILIGRISLSVAGISFTSTVCVTFESSLASRERGINRPIDWGRARSRDSSLASASNWRNDQL